VSAYPRRLRIAGLRVLFIYSSHGTNVIDAGPGNDEIKAHFGRGSIDCGAGNELLYISRRAQRVFKSAAASGSRTRPSATSRSPASASPL
jgi:hypothetical protein